MARAMCGDQANLEPWVFSIYGVESWGLWQRKLTSALRRNRVWHEPLDYGLFRAIRLFSPKSVDAQIEWFRDEYKDCRANSRGLPSIVAHSFGTYIVAAAMERDPEIRFDRVILCGSIIREDYAWTHRIRGEQVAYVLHDYSRSDIVARLAPFVIYDAGASGSHGFVDHGDGRVLQYHHKRLKHSGWFSKVNYDRRWVPFLCGRDPSLQQLKPVHKNWKYWFFRIVFLLILLSALYSFKPEWLEKAVCLFGEDTGVCRHLKHKRIADAFEGLRFSGFHVPPAYKDFCKNELGGAYQTAVFELRTEDYTPWKEIVLDYTVVSTSKNWKITEEVVVPITKKDPIHQGYPGLPPGHRERVRIPYNASGMIGAICGESNKDPVRIQPFVDSLDIRDVQLIKRKGE